MGDAAGGRAFAEARALDLAADGLEVGAVLEGRGVADSEGRRATDAAARVGRAEAEFAVSSVEQRAQRGLLRWLAEADLPRERRTSLPVVEATADPRAPLAGEETEGLLALSAAGGGGRPEAGLVLGRRAVGRVRHEDRRDRDLALEIADGVAAVHRAGLIHRDLKPSNLMVIAQGEGEGIKILDFG
ncbi:MAG: hypothetical protein KC420_05565, partial [Myxococcales bacterium]|nr:hypothetical protein [Myxococcales bacterium]